MIQALLKENGCELPGRNRKEIAKNLSQKWHGHRCAKDDIERELRVAIKSRDLVPVQIHGRQCGYRTLLQSERLEREEKAQKAARQSRYERQRRQKPRFDRELRHVPGSKWGGSGMNTSLSPIFVGYLANPACQPDNIPGQYPGIVSVTVKF